MDMEKCIAGLKSSFDFTDLSGKIVCVSSCLKMFTYLEDIKMKDSAKPG